MDFASVPEKGYNGQMLHLPAQSGLVVPDSMLDHNQRHRNVLGVSGCVSNVHLGASTTPVHPPRSAAWLERVSRRQHHTNGAEAGTGGRTRRIAIPLGHLEPIHKADMLVSPGKLMLPVRAQSVAGLHF